MNRWMTKRLRASVLLAVALASGIDAGVLRVSKVAPDTPHNGINWRQAFTSLDDALAASASGDEIWVAQGTYRPTTPFCIDCPGGPSFGSPTFLIPSGVKVYGGFKGVTNPSDPNDFGDLLLGERDEVANRTILTGGPHLSCGSGPGPDPNDPIRRCRVRSCG